MRLLKRDADLSFSLASFTRDEIPPYTILSHTWGRGKDEEVTYKDLVDGSGQTKAGFKKLRFCAEQTQADGLSYFWIDTCCIDKSDHHELTTAINSMFRWYRNAVKCYVYLPDVSAPAGEGDVVKSTWEPDFSQSRWFKRGYTLQELLAPAIVEFYSRDGVLLGDKTTLQKMISRITGIPSKALKGSSLSDFSTSDILKWTENRQTTLEEDMAYCLLGIFDVSMSLIYGEGQERATKRLLREVAESQRQSARSYSALCRSRIRWYRFSTSRMLLFYEPELWTELVAAACSIDFYWTVVAVSLCSTRLIYLNLPEVTADSHLALRPHGYYPVAKLFAAVLAWYCLLVAITWCIALTPVHLVVPTYFDIWRPYMNVLPLQFSTSLVNLTKYDDFEMPFSISVALLRDTIDPIPSFIVPKPRNRDFIQRPVLISAIEEKFVGARQSHDARVALYGLGGTGYVLTIFSSFLLLTSLAKPNWRSNTAIALAIKACTAISSGHPVYPNSS